MLNLCIKNSSKNFSTKYYIGGPNVKSQMLGRCEDVKCTLKCCIVYFHIAKISLAWAALSPQHCLSVYRGTKLYALHFFQPISIFMSCTTSRIQQQCPCKRVTRRQWKVRRMLTEEAQWLIIPTVYIE